MSDISSDTISFPSGGSTRWLKALWTTTEASPSYASIVFLRFLDPRSFRCCCGSGPMVHREEAEEELVFG